MCEVWHYTDVKYGCTQEVKGQEVWKPLSCGAMKMKISGVVKILNEKVLARAVTSRILWRQIRSRRGTSIWLNIY